MRHSIQREIAAAAAADADADAECVRTGYLLFHLKCLIHFRGLTLKFRVARNANDCLFAFLSLGVCFLVMP